MSVSDIDLSTVDERLKCAYSQQLLRDAVRLPCCSKVIINGLLSAKDIPAREKLIDTVFLSKVVSDKAIREALFSTIDFRCPLCNQVGIVPDEVSIAHSSFNIRIH
jgi:hypothetical protein